MDKDQLTGEEKLALLRVARESLELSIRGEKLPSLDLRSMPQHLKEWGASFITLTIQANLRGCIGALEPYQPLALDVREHSIAAAIEDPRFPRVTPPELGQISIEISRLSIPETLDYLDPEDLLSKLRPALDGLIMRDGFRRATFLPQVWEKIPDRSEFLDNLCMKMGVAANTWRLRHLELLVYRVEDFHE